MALFETGLNMTYTYKLMTSTRWAGSRARDATRRFHWMQLHTEP